jgi:hypothetical protein
LFYFFHGTDIDGYTKTGELAFKKRLKFQSANWAASGENLIYAGPEFSSDPPILYAGPNCDRIYANKNGLVAKIAGKYIFIYQRNTVLYRIKLRDVAIAGYTRIWVDAKNIIWVMYDNGMLFGYKGSE